MVRFLTEELNSVSVHSGRSNFGWTQKPLGFKGGDTNLYRYVMNDPTNATDPTGEVIVFTEEIKAKAYLEELKAKGASNVQLINGKAGKAFYVVTDARDTDAVFKAVDTKFPELFTEKDFFSDKTLNETAKRRNRLLSASGIFGFDDRFVTDVSGEVAVVVKEDVEILQKLFEKLKETEGAVVPLHIDIGGEGGTPGAVNVNIGGLRRGKKPVPRLVAGVFAGTALPFPDNSIGKVTIENTLGLLPDEVFDFTKKELARLIQRGGSIVVFEADTELARSRPKSIANAILGFKGLAKRAGYQGEAGEKEGAKTFKTVITVEKD